MSFALNSQVFVVYLVQSGRSFLSQMISPWPNLAINHLLKEIFGGQHLMPSYTHNWQGQPK